MKASDNPDGILNLTLPRRPFFVDDTVFGSESVHFSCGYFPVGQLEGNHIFPHADFAAKIARPAPFDGKQVY